MKRTKRVVALVLAVMLTFAIVGCGKSSLIGTWEFTQDGMTASYTFEEDGTGKMSALGFDVDMTYTTSGDKLTLKVSILGEETEESYTYKVNGKTLTLTDGNETLELKKK